MNVQGSDILSELSTRVDIVLGINAFWSRRGGLYPEKWLLLDLHGIDEDVDILGLLEELGVKWEFNRVADRFCLAIRIT
jgi:hypothetical protein